MISSLSIERSSACMFFELVLLCEKKKINKVNLINSKIDKR